jgi:hypothetical protein
VTKIKHQKSTKGKERRKTKRRREGGRGKRGKAKEKRKRHKETRTIKTHILEIDTPSQSQKLHTQKRNSQEPYPH